MSISTQEPNGTCATLTALRANGCLAHRILGQGAQTPSYRLALRPSQVKRTSCALQVLTEPSCSLDPCPRGPGGLPHRARRECPGVPTATHSRHPASELSHLRRARRPESSLKIMSSIFSPS